MVTGSGERRFHDQISWLMFLFSIFVIWVHSYNVDLFSGGARDGIWSLADRIENFRVGGTGTNRRSWLFPAVLLPVFPEFFLGEADRKMEEPGIQRPDPLCSLESHLLSGLYGSIPVSRHTIRGRT